MLEKNAIDDVEEALRKHLVGDLKPLAPNEGLKRYVKSKQEELSSSTLDEYERVLNQFVDYCESRGIENLNELSGRTIDGFRTWLREESSSKVDTLSSKTMRDRMYLFSDFLSYLESIEGVPSGTAEKVIVPKLGDEEGIRDVCLSQDHINQVTSYLEKFEYASREHVVWVLFTHTGRRLGGVHSLDRDDVYINRDDPYLHFQHRPPETKLKNGTKSEERVNITTEVAEIIGDYIETARIDVETDAGREPLVTTRHGRISQSSLRRYVYKWTRPCAIGLECPHDRDPEECDAADRGDDYSKCPSSEAPHALRHTYLTEQRKQGISTDLLGERCDVSPDVLEKHYDERTPEERRKQRRLEFGGAAEKSGGEGR